MYSEACKVAGGGGTEGEVWLVVSRMGGIAALPLCLSSRSL